MKIVNKEQFYKLPKGTLYSDYVPSSFDGLKIKGETIFNDGVPIDFFYEDLIGNIHATDEELFKAENFGSSIEISFDGIGRDGLFEKVQLFGIYEKKDLIQFIEKLESLK